MTYTEALAAACAGKYVRHKGMGKGWTVGCLEKFPGMFWNFNPHTGSEYQYTPLKGDDTRTDWYIAKNRRDA